MHHKSITWIKLKLKNDTNTADAYTRVHTHMAMFSSCIEEGATIAFYQPDTYRRSRPGAVFYLKTDSPAFYKSCIRSYNSLFEVTEMEGNFELPPNYELVHGKDNLHESEALSL